MPLDGLTVSALVALVVVLLFGASAALYALRLLRRTEDAQLTTLRDIVRVVYHGR
jgi:hypothetical protein